MDPDTKRSAGVIVDARKELQYDVRLKAAAYCNEKLSRVPGGASVAHR